MGKSAVKTTKDKAAAAAPEVSIGDEKAAAVAQPTESAAQRMTAEKVVIPPPNLPVFAEEEDDGSENMKEVLAGADDVFKGVVHALGQIASLERALASSPIEVLDSKGSTWRKGLAAFTSYVEATLQSPMRAYVRAATLALVKVRMDQAATYAEAMASLAVLQREGRLALTQNGPFELFGKQYTLAGDLLEGFNPQRDTQLAGFIAEISKAIAGLRARSFAAREKERADKAQGLLEHGALCWKDVLAGKTGLWAAILPDAIERKAPGDPFYRHGGVALVFSNGKAVYLRDANQHLQLLPKEASREGMNLGVTLQSLTAEKPRFTEFISDQLELARMNRLWAALRSAGKTEEEAENLLPVRRQFEQEATASAQDWFMEKTPDSSCFAEHQGAWKVLNVNGEVKVVDLIHNFFLVLERKEVDGVVSVGMVKIPPHLNALLGKWVGKFFPETDKFEDCPGLVKAVLQNLHGQAVKTASGNK